MHNHTNIELPKQLSKTKNVEPSSFYQNLKFTPNNGSSITLGNSTQTSIIELTPQSIINFSKLKLQFTRSALSAAAGASNYYFLNNSFCSFINRLQIFDSKNLILLDLNNCEIVSKALQFNKEAADRTETNCFNFWGYRGSYDTVIATSHASPYYYPLILVSGSTYKAVPVNCIDEPSTIEVSYTGGAVGANGNLLARNYNFNLSDLAYDSILSLDRNIYSANSIFIKITWNPMNKITGGIAADFGIVAPASTTNLSGVSFTLSNIQLNMYSEGNPVLANIIKSNPLDECIIYPEPQLNVLSFSGTTQQSSMRIISNALPGEARLYKMYYWLAVADSGLYINNTSNLVSTYPLVCGAIATSWRLYLNNNLTLDINISASQEDLELVQNQYRTNSFKSNSCYYENGGVSYVFCSEKANSSEYSQMVLKGVDFNQNGEIILQNYFTINGSQTLTHYAMFVVLRTLYIQNGVFSWYPSVR